MSTISAEFFDSHAVPVGAVIAGRRTDDISGARGARDHGAEFPSS
jgi:hypothetical protein